MKLEQLLRIMCFKRLWYGYLTVALLSVLPLWYADGAITSVTLDGMFDCRRDDRDCSDQGSCGIKTGECTCGTNFVNYDCGLNATALSNTCGKVCLNGGQCYIQDGIENCSCALGYYGQDCQEKRADVTCDGSKFIVYLTPLTTPARVFVPGYRGNAACNGMKIGSQGQTLYIEVSLTSGCGAGTPETMLQDTPNVGDTIFQNWLVVQYNEGFLSPLDNVYTLRCVTKATEFFSATAGITVVSIDQRKSLDQHLVQSQYDGAIFQILNSERKVIDGPVFSGTPLILRVFLQSTDVYSAIRFERCVASDRKGGTGRKIVIVKEGCVVWHPPTSHMVILDPITPGPQQSLPVAAIRFGRASNVHISCTVVMCKEPAHCALHKLCSPHNAFGRSKRSMDKPDKEIVLSVKVRMAQDLPLEYAQKTDIISETIPEGTDSNGWKCSLPYKMEGLYIIVAVAITFIASSTIMAIKYRRLKERHGDAFQMKPQLKN